MIVAADIATLALVMAAWTIWAARSRKVAIAVVAAAAIQFALASAGVLRQGNHVPPPLMPLVAITLAITLTLALSRTGRSMAERHSFAMLVGAQAFRLPLELVMHHAATTGLMPVQMSYSGFNFDILTGITAIPVAWLASRNRAPRWLIVAWNTLGCVLLATIVSIAIVSLPGIQAFGPDRVNTWVADAPYVWLPGVLVPCALLGHVLVWRKLAARA